MAIIIHHNVAIYIHHNVAIHVLVASLQVHPVDSAAVKTLCISISMVTLLEISMLSNYTIFGSSSIDSFQVEKSKY